MLVFFYFVWKSREAAKSFDKSIYEVKWAASGWIYFVSIVACLSFGHLYLLQYYDQGFALKPNFLVVIWLRWIYVGFIGALYMGILNYIMTRKPHGGQSFFSTLLYIVSIGALLAATLSQSEITRIIWIITSIVWFFFSVFLLCWPESKLWGRDYNEVKQIIFSVESIWKVMTDSLPSKHREASIKIWTLIYRIILVIQIVLAYVGYLINWFLSDSNEFTTVGTLDTTILVFLILDLIFIVPFTLLLVYLTFKNVTKKVTARNYENNHKHIASFGH